MKLITWSQYYSVDNKDIDEQHERLAEMINQVYNLIPKRDWDEVEKVFEKLFAYTKCHFELEEKYMEAAKFPDIEEHKKLHKKLLSEATETFELFKKDRYRGSVTLLAFLRQWLSKHILGSDKAYSPYMKKWGVSSKIKKINQEPSVTCNRFKSS